MKVWLACFGVLFALAELYQWVKHLMLPLPIYILGGAFLAIASNYDKFSWMQRDAAQVPPVVPAVNPSNAQSIPASETLGRKLHPISFTIPQSKQSDDCE